jgi:hypothetical protein
MHNTIFAAEDEDGGGCGPAEGEERRRVQTGGR